MSHSDNIGDFRKDALELQERERQLDSLMGNLPGLAYRALADEHWTCLFVSKGIEDVTGYTPDDFTTRRVNYDDIMLPEDRQATRETILTALQQREMYEDEHRIRHKDGSIRWIWARGHGVFAADGSLRFLEGLNLDITDRKQAEEALRESEERFRGTFENAAVGIIQSDSAGCFLRVNQKFCAIVGYSREELLNKTLRDIIHPDELNAHIEHYEASFAQDETPPFGVQRRFLRKDGTTLWVEAYASFQHDASGQPVYAISAVQDITERKRVEEALRQANARLDLAVRGSNLAIWECDMPDGRIENSHLTLTNFLESLGYDSKTAPVDFPSLVALTMHPDDQGRAGREIQEFLVSDRRVFETEVRARHKNGSDRWHLTRGVVVRDQTGKAVRFIGTSADITDLKRAEEALRQSNARLNLAVRGSNLAIWECDMPDGRIENSHLTLANMWESLGYDAPTSPTDFSSAFALLLHPDDQQRVMSELQELFGGDGVDYESKYRVRSKDGSTRWHLARGTVLRNSNGKPARFIGTSTDITDLKRAEEALRENEQRWRSLTETLPQLVWSATPDGTCDYFSSQWTEHTGVAEAELLGWRWLETLHPDDREPTRRFWLESVAGDHAYDIEYRVRRRDGEYRWFKTRGVPIRDTGGKIVKWFGTCTDITELRDSEERFRGTFENAAVGIGHRHLDGRFLRVNRKFCTILGYSRDELLKKTGPGVTHPDDLDLGVDLAEALLRGESSGFTQEKRYVRRDGTPVWVDLSVSLQRDAAGKPGYFIGIVQDISNRKQLEGELRQAKDAAEAANRAKDEFLANVSHEIRTPMNAIIGMTELVLDTPLDEDQRQGLKTVRSAAESLLDIINDLLDFSKIEAGKLELINTDFSLRGAVTDSLRAVAVRAHKKGLELIYQVQPDVPDALVGDVGRLRQVLLNLAGNAVKFTDDGEVVVRVEVDKGDTPPFPAEDVGLCFTVRDTGIGIPVEQQERIFRAFEQEDTSTTRRYGGTGLGLTIAARLVGLMSGTITVDSTPGRGSTFTFTAHFSRQPHATESASAQPPDSPGARLKNLQVLVVDDNGTNRQILEEWLRDWQMNPTAVGDGMAAMDALWHRAANDGPFALVLMDARMPDADGLTVAAKIRERAELADTRIILLTSGERPGDPARSRELRIDAQLLKPVQQDELLETIYRVMSRSQGDAPFARTKSRQPAGTAPVPAATSLHILVAEDNEISAQVLEQALIRQGHRVRVASNSREVLTLAQQGGFDLVLLDVHMPELDGFQVVRAVRERESTAGGHLPIIALTARSRKEDRERCLAAGMDDFQTKPIRPADLLAAIDRVLKAHSPRQSRKRDLVDAPVLLAACGGDPMLLKKMCQTLAARVPQHLIALREARRDNDAPRLREAAHKSCGMLSEFSATAGDLAGTLEDLAAGAQIDKAAPVLDQLESIAHELVKQIDGITVEELHRLAEAVDERSGTTNL